LLLPSAAAEMVETLVAAAAQVEYHGDGHQILEHLVRLARVRKDQHH
jgi:hypothetical protein